MAKGRPTAITSLADAPSDGKRNWLIYADSGKGKTVLAGTAPNALFLTVEAAGTESAKAFGSTADEWVVDTWDELRDAFDWLKSGGHNDYEWVILDSLSEMEEAAWKAHLEEMHENNSNRSIFQPAIQDYQIIGNKIKRMVDNFNRMPINVLYTAQTMKFGKEDEDGEEFAYMLPLLGSANNGILSQKVCGMVTLVGLLTVQRPKDKDEESTRRLWLEGAKNFIAKDRHDTFGKFVDGASIEEMNESVTARQEKGKAKAVKKTATRQRKTNKED